jgi:protein translocase SecG subunit
MELVMLYELLIVLYVLACFLLAGIVLMQKSKSSLGFGALGGGNQMLFGGSGGQELFQKITWVLGAIFIAGSLFLAIMKTHKMKQFKYTLTTQEAVVQKASVVPQAPIEPEAQTEQP